MMIRTAAAACSAALALVGCSAEAEPEPLPLPSPASVSASPTPAALPVPPAAMAETAQGAAAFTRFFFGDVVNQAYAMLDPSAVTALSTSGCGSCANIVSDVERLRDAGLSVDGDRFMLAFAEATPAAADGSTIVDFRFSSDPYVERDARGKEVRAEPEQVDQDAQAKLVRREGAWAVEAIRTVEL